MKYPLLFISFLFLLFHFCSITPMTAQDNSLKVVSIHGKKFLSLAPEPAPENMFWGKFGTVVETYYGVTAYSNGDQKSGRIYQCTELAHRFVSEIYGIPSRINQGMGHGKDLAKNMAIFHKSVVGTSDTLDGHFVCLENFENGKSIYPPLVGSVVSMHFDSRQTGYGHVAIIRDLKVNEEGFLEATLFDQHGFAHMESEIPIQADCLLFEKDANGCWSGHVLSWKNNRKYPVISWTNPVIVEETPKLQANIKEEQFQKSR